MRLTADSFSDDLLSTQAVVAYFKDLYDLRGKELDHKQNPANAPQRWAKPRFSHFQTIADKFRMIEKPHAAADYSVRC